MRCRRRIAGTLLILGLGIGGTLSAQETVPDPEPEPPVVSTAIVPVVGRTVGIGNVEWSADVRLTNPSKEPVDVILTAPAVEGDPFVFLTIEPGQSAPLPDIAREAFGVSNALTPLLVQTLGERSVGVECVIRGVGPDGAVRPQVPRILYSRPNGLTSILSGLRIDEDYRTNIGLANVGEETAMATISLQRLTGRTIDTTTVQLPPRSLQQMSLAELFPIITEGSDLSLVIEFMSPDSYAYASVLQNESHDGRFVGP